MTAVFSFPGLFEAWAYDVSHGRLLFRRKKTEEFKTRVDVVFVNTVYVQGPTTFVSFCLEELTSEEIPDQLTLSKELLHPSLRCYRLSTRDGTYYICAGNVFWKEDELRYTDPSSVYKPSGLLRELGRSGYS